MMQYSSKKYEMEQVASCVYLSTRQIFYKIYLSSMEKLHVKIK